MQSSRAPRPHRDDIERRELPVRHARHAGDDRNEGPDERHEASQDDRRAAVLFEEGVRRLNVLGLKKRDFGRLKSFGPARVPR